MVLALISRKISMKDVLKKGMYANDTQAYLNLFLETVALTEQQQQLQVWFWFRRITRTKRVDERRMNDLRKDVMQQDSSTGRLVRSKVRWAGHMVRMDADILVKRVEEKGGKISRMQEMGKRTTKIEGLHEVGYEKIGGR